MCGDYELDRLVARRIDRAIAHVLQVQAWEHGRATVGDRIEAIRSWPTSF